jgi:N-acetyl-gamma-glutamyl-phosphate reductase
MDLTRVAVLGASGYTGALLCRLLARHPGVHLVSAERDATAQLREQGVAMALLCTPAEASLELVPPLVADGVRVLDLSGAFRLPDPEVFARAYGRPHTAPALLPLARYALPEVTGVAGLRDAVLVANPGCYVTAALLALAPLMRRGLVLPGAPLFVDGKSGASGAGRKAALELSLCELEGEVRPYRLGRHQHTPEMQGVLARLCGAPVDLHFAPHLIGTRRGLLCTCHGQLRPGVSAAAVQAAYAEDYAAAARVHVVPPEEVTLHRPVGTPDAWVGACVTGAVFCAVASLDNLLKGAASQAVQNLNAMLGLPDGTGLDELWSPAA